MSVCGRRSTCCIDRDEAIQLLTEGSGIKAGPIPPAHKIYALPEDDPDLVEYFRHDIADAKKLLEAASFDFNQEIELKHSVRPVDSNLAQVLQAQFKRGGVNVKLLPEDLVKWFSQSLGTGNFHMTCFLHLPYEDPDLPLRFYLGAEGDRKNFMGYKDADVDTAVLAAAQELDEKARIEKVNGGAEGDHEEVRADAQHLLGDRLRRALLLREGIDQRSRIVRAVQPHIVAGQGVAP